MGLSKILVFSEESRGRVFVGELTKTNGGYAFVYDHDYMSRSSATPLGPDLPLSMDEIKSKKLFNSLTDLIPSRDNPAYEQYCHSVGINPDEMDPLVLLACLGKGPSTFVFEPAPDDTSPSGGDVLRFRNDLGLSQRQFAQLFDIPFPTLQTIEKETSEARTARRLIQIFIDDPSTLWRVIKRRGIYLHTRQRLKIEDYIRQKEHNIGAQAFERQKSCRQLGYVEVYHEIAHPNRTWNQIELLKAAEQAACRNTGWPVGVVLHTEAGRPVFKGDGLEVELESGPGRYDEWYLKRNGSFHFFRTFGEDRKTFPKKSGFLYFDTRIWRISEILLHCESLYSALGVGADELIEVRLMHSGLAERKIAAANELRAISRSERKCLDNSIQEWNKKTSVGDLGKNRLDYVMAISRELFMLFDGWQPADGVIEGIYEEFLKSRI